MIAACKSIPSFFPWEGYELLISRKNGEAAISAFSPPLHPEKAYRYRAVAEPLAIHPVGAEDVRREKKILERQAPFDLLKLFCTETGHFFQVFPFFEVAVFLSIRNDSAGLIR